jgi:hypothetical protein
MGVLRRARAPFERIMLHSPARRRSYDRSVVLLRYRGRDTGAFHERAVPLARDESRLIAVSPRRAKDWWRDFRPSGPAVVVLDDVQLGVVGRTVDGIERPLELAQVLRTYLDWFPRAARELGVHRAHESDDLEGLAAGFVAVVFDLRSEAASR